MTEKERRLVEFAEQAARDGFRSVALRTELITPSLAAEVLRHLPAEDGFDPAKIADFVEDLPEGTGESLALGKTSSQAYVSVAVPRNPRHAFEWAEELMAATSATSAKMNFGPGKPTHLKIFWGKPEVNTLIEIGGDD